MSKRPSKFNRKVSPTWAPVRAFEQRQSRMAWSDRVWYWLVSLGGIAITLTGVGVFAFLHLERRGGWLVGIGFVVFILSSPSRAARNGYRDVW